MPASRAGAFPAYCAQRCAQRSAGTLWGLRRFVQACAAIVLLHPCVEHLLQRRLSVPGRSQGRQLPARRAAASDAKLSSEAPDAGILGKPRPHIEETIPNKTNSSKDESTIKHYECIMDKVERIEWQTGLFEPQNCMSLNSCFGCLCPCHAYGCLPRKAHDNEVNIGCAKDLGECECGNGCFGASCCLYLVVAGCGMPCIMPCESRCSYRNR